MLRWHRVLTPQDALARDDFHEYANFPHGLLEKRRRWGADFQLHDDCATRYDNAGPLVGWIGLYPDDSDRHHSGPTAVRGFVTFVPAVPPDATRLVGVNGSDCFTITLA